MIASPSWEADRQSAGQEIRPCLWKPIVDYRFTRTTPVDNNLYGTTVNETFMLTNCSVTFRNTRKISRPT